MASRDPYFKHIDRKFSGATSEPELSPWPALRYTVAPARSGGSSQMYKQVSQVIDETQSAAK